MHQWWTPDGQGVFWSEPSSIANCYCFYTLVHWVTFGYNEVTLVVRADIHACYYPFCEVMLWFWGPEGMGRWRSWFVLSSLFVCYYLHKNVTQLHEVISIDLSKCKLSGGDRWGDWDQHVGIELKDHWLVLYGRFNGAGVLGISSLGPCLSSTGVLPLSVSMVGSRVASTYFLMRDVSGN